MKCAAAVHKQQFLGILFSLLFCFSALGSDARALTPPAVPSDWWTQVQRNLAEEEYQVTWQKQTSLPDVTEAWQAPNRAQGLRTYFTERGPRMVSRVETEASWIWGLEFVAFGEGGTSAPPPKVTDTQTNGNRIEFHRGKGLMEWYVNAPRGLEQGFTVAKDAWSFDNTRAVIDLAVCGTLNARMGEDCSAVEFVSGGGVTVIHYGHLAASDAQGKALPATMALAENNTRIKITVDSTGAVFPITIDPLATSAAWTAESNQASAALGSSVATAGDINDDGRSDVIVGAPKYDGGQADEGRVYVFRGTAAGLSTEASWTAESNQVSAQFGASVSTAGDVNGDGFSDVIVGSYGYDNGETDEGAAFLWYGSVIGLGSDGSPSNADWTGDGGQVSAEYGRSVSTAGDLNGDGYADIIIGAPKGENGQGAEGLAYVYLGSSSGPGSAIRKEMDVSSANFGWSVSTAGDVNGDGLADVIIGAPTYANGQTAEGKAYVYHGHRSTGIAASPSWSVEINETEARYGLAVATTGDVNGDGYADVIVGAPFHDVSHTNEGAAFVYHGSSGGLSTTAAVTITPDVQNAQFGSSVATAGDVNGDGYADIVAGSPLYSGDQMEEGCAYLYYGASGGVSATAAWTVEGNQSNAHFGYSVAIAGDVNADGYSDVIVGAPEYDAGEANEGCAFVYHGSSSGVGTSAGWTGNGDQMYASLGCSVATAGDVNGDGYADVIVGAPYYDAGEDNEGRVYVFLGSSTGLSGSEDWKAESNQANSSFGFSVSTAGDINCDGYADIIVGSHRYSNGQTEEGVIFLWYGSLTGLGEDGTPANADWTAESNQASAWFGYSVSTAGDVNGDGCSDIIVGAPYYDYDQTNDGAAFVWYGGPFDIGQNGTPATAHWMAESDIAEAMFGISVSTAGDVNRDSYSDVIIGASYYTNPMVNEGLVCVYHGSIRGLGEHGTPGNADWKKEGNAGSLFYGNAVASAGDVNGDGYADVIIGAEQYYISGEWIWGVGRAYVYHGSEVGLDTSAAWIVTGDQENAYLGCSVSTAGDVNGDGYADVVVGEDSYDNGQTNEGRAHVYLGSTGGLSATPDWTMEGNSNDAKSGASVSSAGDVNGDGYADILVGASGYNGARGRACVYYGNGEAGRGLSVNPRQRTPDDYGPLAHLGSTDPVEGVLLAALGRTPFGRGKVKLQGEIAMLGQAFDEFPGETSLTPDWTDTGTAGIELSGVLGNLLTHRKAYHWRAWVLYSPASSPYQQWSRCFTMPWNGGNEADFRRPDVFPTAPSNPGATVNGTDSITWEWQDNSDNEMEFLVYVDQGHGDPSTLRATVGPDTTSWEHTGLDANTPYTFWVSVSGLDGEGGRTAGYTAWTFIEAVSGLGFSGVTDISIDVAATNTPSDLDQGDSGVYFENVTEGTNSGWLQNTAPWTSPGLSPNTQYSFSGKSRNGEQVETSPVTEIKYTLAATPAAPVVENATANSLAVAIGAGDGNPPETLYAIQIAPSALPWLGIDGLQGPSPVYQTAGDWGTLTVPGLAEYTEYSFSVIAQNGDGMDTLPGPAQSARTLDGTHILSHQAICSHMPFCSTYRKIIFRSEKAKQQLNVFLRTVSRNMQIFLRVVIMHLNIFFNKFIYDKIGVGF